ncbi:MAG: cytidylate kinase-like family protein [Pirellulaceae bacterium]
MSSPVASIEHHAERNIQKWIYAGKTQKSLDRSTSNKHVGPYLAISRETGACGSEIAKIVAERLQWDLLDNEIVDYMEQHYGTPRCLIQRVDERHESWLSMMITSQIGGLGFSESAYTHRVAKLLLLAASHGDVVIVGRGARFILPRQGGLSVRLVAPIEYRIQQVMDQRRLDKKQARVYIVRTDHERNAYIKDHFNVDASDPHLYDFVLNIGDLSVDEAADTLIQFVDQWKSRRHE